MARTAATSPAVRSIAGATTATGNSSVTGRTESAPLRAPRARGPRSDRLKGRGCSDAVITGPLQTDPMRRGDCGRTQSVALWGQYARLREACRGPVVCVRTPSIRAVTGDYGERYRSLFLGCARELRDPDRTAIVSGAAFSRACCSVTPLSMVERRLSLARRHASTTSKITITPAASNHTRSATATFFLVLEASSDSHQISGAV